MEPKKRGGGKKSESKVSCGEEKKGASLEEHEKTVMELAERFGDKGFTDEEVSRTIPSLSKEQRVLLVNKLISKSVLDIFVSQSGNIVYKNKSFDASLDSALRGADTEEKVVYGIIKEAGNKGIWMRDIRFKSNLLPTQLNKVLKSLENKKVIKAVKSVAAHKKKVYMLYGVEADSTVTGGSWYSGEDFEAEFVDVLNQQCYRFLCEAREDRKKGPIYQAESSTPARLCQYIAELNISRVSLSEDDIQSILDTLVYDGKVEKTRNGGYRAVAPLLPPQSGLTVLPCAVCPVINRCHQNSFVTSIKCPYIQDWGKNKC